MPVQLGEKHVVAAIQAESVWLDAEGGIDKSLKLIEEAAAAGAEVVGFPAFVPGYPLGIFEQAPSADFIKGYAEQCITTSSPQFARVQAAVKKANIWVAFAFGERDGDKLYLSQAFIGPDGAVALHRRKLGLSASEKAIFSEGGAESLHTVVGTHEGNMIGGLQSWEQVKTLLRYYTYGQGVQVAVGAWPPRPSGDLPLIESAYGCGDVVSRQFASEGGSFGLVCTGIVSAAGAEKMGTTLVGGGFARIFGPAGDLLAQAKDGASDEVVVAEVDFDDIHVAKQMADCIGQYTRPDLYSITVKHEALVQFGV